MADKEIITTWTIKTVEVKVDNIPWLSENKLEDFQVNIPEAEWSKFFMWYWTISAVWWVEFTWIGFKPKYISVSWSIATWNQFSNSEWFSDWTNQKCIYSAWDADYSFSTYTNDLITLYAQDSDYDVNIVLDHFTDDWFYLVGNRIETTAHFIYKCYG